MFPKSGLTGRSADLNNKVRGFPLPSDGETPTRSWRDAQQEIAKTRPQEVDSGILSTNFQPNCENRVQMWTKYLPIFGHSVVMPFFSYTFKPRSESLSCLHPFRPGFFGC